MKSSTAFILGCVCIFLEFLFLILSFYSNTWMFGVFMTISAGIGFLFFFYWYLMIDGNNNRKIPEKIILRKCLDFLDYSGVDYSKDIIELNENNFRRIPQKYDEDINEYFGRYFYEYFGEYNINCVAKYVAKKLHKKIVIK